MVLSALVPYTFLLQTLIGVYIYVYIVHILTSTIHVHILMSPVFLGVMWINKLLID